MTLLTLKLPTALVIDVGYVESSVAPVIEGVTLLDRVQFAPLGSRAIHERITAELAEQKATIKEAEDTEARLFTENDKLSRNVLEDIKVRTCFVAPFKRGQALIEIKGGKSQIVDSECPPQVCYPIDGSKLLIIPGIVREMACQVLFEVYGHESSLATLVLEALLKSPLDSRKTLASNIILVGGTTLLPGFKNRFLKDIVHLAQTDHRFKENLHVDTFKIHKPPCKENYVAWLGAAIFGSTDAITMKAITREQFLKSTGAIMSDWSDWWPQSRAA